MDGLQLERLGERDDLFEQGRTVVDADGFTLLADEVGGALHHGCPFHYLLHLAEHVVVEGRRGAPGLPCNRA